MKEGARPLLRDLDGEGGNASLVCGRDNLMGAKTQMQAV